jgi:hypothetical protein
VDKTVALVAVCDMKLPILLRALKCITEKYRGLSSVR